MLSLFKVDTSRLQKHGFHLLKPMVLRPETLGFTA